MNTCILDVESNYHLRLAREVIIIGRKTASLNGAACQTWTIWSYSELIWHLLWHWPPPLKPIITLNQSSWSGTYNVECISKYIRSVHPRCSVSSLMNATEEQFKHLLHKRQLVRKAQFLHSRQNLATQRSVYIHTLSILINCKKERIFVRSLAVLFV